MPKKTPYPYGSINPPLCNSVAFCFDSVAQGAEAFLKYGSRFAYGRMGTPSVKPLEEWLAELEGVPHGSVWATHTGMAAIKLLIEGITSNRLGRGQTVLASPYLYGGTCHLLEILKNNGCIEVTWVEDPFDISSWESGMCATRPYPALVFLETPSNPNVDIFDIESIGELSRHYGSRFVVDNTLGVGLQNPIALGADGVVYSVTKAINGKSSELGGAIVASPDFLKEIEETVDDLFVHSGIIMHPQSALAAYENRTTLKRDMRIFSQNALMVAEFFEGNPRVKKVNYPMLLSSPYYELAQKQMPDGAGGLLSFELRSFEAAVRFVEEQEEAYLAVHLGDANNNLITHPASTTHAKLSSGELARLGITPELVRLSVSLAEYEKIRTMCVEFEKILARL